MKSKFLKRIAMIAVALTVCVVGMSVQNTSYAASVTKPKNFIVAVVDNKTTLVWDKVKGASKYQVYRATSKNGTYKAVKTTTNEYWIDTKAKSDNYWYKVRAVKGKNKSSFTSKRHTFYALAKYNGYTKKSGYRIYKMKVTNYSKSKNMYFIPEIEEHDGVSGALFYNKKRDTFENNQCVGQLCNSKGKVKTTVQTIGKKKTAYVYIRVKESECKRYSDSNHQIMLYGCFLDSKNLDNLYILMNNTANSKTTIMGFTDLLQFFE